MAKTKGVTKKLFKTGKPKKSLKKSASVTSKLKLEKTLKTEGKRSLTLLKMQKIANSEKERDNKVLKVKTSKGSSKKSLKKEEELSKLHKSVDRIDDVKKKIKMELNEDNKEVITESKSSEKRPKLKGGFSLDEEQISNGVRALFQLIESTCKKVELFDEEQPIFMQISCMKIPKAPIRHLRIALKHSILTDSSEICFIGCDFGKRHEFDDSVEHYEAIFKKHNINNINMILPLAQLKAEYGEYENLRALIDLYDCFLVDAKISGHTLAKLGKIAIQKRKQPTPVRCNINNLKEHFDQSLKKVVLNLHWKGDCQLVQIGHTKMKHEEIVENILATTEQLGLEFPGGFDNFRSLSIKTPTSIDIPLYVALRSKSSVLVPVVAPKRPKEFVAVTGELSTRLNTNVTVHPSGRVMTHKIENKTKKDAVKRRTKTKKLPSDVKKQLKVTVTHNEKKIVVEKDAVDSEEELEKIEEFYEREYGDNFLEKAKEKAGKIKSHQSVSKNKKKRTISEGDVKKVPSKNRKLKTNSKY